MAHLLVFLLLLLGLKHWPSLAETKVNLITPMLTKLNFESCDAKSNYSLCDYSLSTRGGDFLLKDYNTSSGHGHIEMVGDWHEPSLYKDEKTFYYEGCKESFVKQIEQMKYFLKTVKLEEFSAMTSASLFEPCHIAHHDGNVVICFRDNKLAVSDLGAHNMEIDLFNSYLELKSFTRDNHHGNYFSPLVQMAPTIYLSEEKTFVFLTSDLAGRLIVNKIAKNTGRLFEATQYNLGRVINHFSIANSSENYTYPELLDNQLRNKLNENMLTKSAVTMMNAITPVFIRTSAANSSDKDKNFDNDNNQIALCLHNNLNVDGLKVRENRNDSTNCYWKGENQRDYLPKLSVANNPPVYFHAYDVINHLNGSYLHLMYDMTIGRRPLNTTRRYIFCKFDFNLQHGKQCNYTINLYAPTGNDDFQQKCIIRDFSSIGSTDGSELVNAPNDIITFDDGKCIKTIAFYDFIYTVHDIGQPIHEKNQTIGTLDGITFIIRAAYSIRDKIYFFVGANSLIIAKAQMVDDCKRLVIDFDSSEEYYAQDYILRNAFQNGTEPVLKGDRYRDFQIYESGSNDTRPSAFVDPLPDGAPVNQGKIEPTPPVTRDPRGQSKGVNMVLIGAIAIVAGIVIVTLTYLFCLRDNDAEKETTQVRIIKKMERGGENELSNNHKTVRSNIKLDLEPTVVRKSSKPPKTSVKVT